LLEGYIRLVRRVLPSPFSIAIALTVVSFFTVFVLNFSNSADIQLVETLDWWASGLWTPSLMVFAMQMMLMLVLGHALALSPVFDSLIARITARCHTTSQAAALVCLFAMIVGLFNWGLGLIFGAILARKMGESFSSRSLKLNYPLIGAAGYAALMIWHGGLSGSALIKVAETGNLHELMSGSLTAAELQMLPDSIGIDLTVFSTGNVLINLCVISILPIALFLIGKKPVSNSMLVEAQNPKIDVKIRDLIGAEKFDHSRIAILSVGLLTMSYCTFLMFFSGNPFLSFFNPNNINLLLLALCLVLHKNFLSFLSAVNSAIGGASGILIQFPLYFGIMGLFNESGLILTFSDFFVSISNTWTYPIFTYLSAGLVNIFVPSGGGQWVIQGPIIIKSALELGVPLEKSILALAYGDQITNMLQPFWALPLLGITGLNVRHILPYTLIMFLIGFFIYMIGLLLI
jgi:short-chain fatty acids transporter